MEMTDDGESDFKVLGVLADDRRWEDVQDLEDLNQHNLKEYKHFFETYKELKEKDVVVTIDAIKGKAAAVAAVERSVKLYNDTFAK